MRLADLSACESGDKRSRKSDLSLNFTDGAVCFRIIRAMKKLLSLRRALLVAAIASATASPSADVFTSLAVSAFTPRTFAFPGTDGRTHLVYELLLTNTNVTPATVESVEVVDCRKSDEGSRHLRRQKAPRQPTHDRQLRPSKIATIEFNGSRLLMIQFELDSNSAVPEKLLHRVKFLGATSPSPKPATPEAATYTVAPIEIETKIPHIGAPLAGSGWVAFNGCCDRRRAPLQQYRLQRQHQLCPTFCD